MYTVIIMKHSINMLYSCRQISNKFILSHSKVKYINFCSIQSRYTQNICLTISWLNCFFKSILEPTFFSGICGYSVLSLLLCTYSIAQHFWHLLTHTRSHLNINRKTILCQFPVHSFSNTHSSVTTWLKHAIQHTLLKNMI